MKNLKKVFAVVIALSLVLTAMIPAFAETATTYTYEAEANVLHSVGLYAGVSTTEFDPDLGNNLTREQAVTLISALFGLGDQAKALTDAEATTLLKDVKDVNKISSWAKKYVAYAIKTKISGGYPNGNWGPQDKIVGKQIAKMILNQLGYTDNTKYPYATAAEELAKLSGLAPTAAKEMNDKELLRDDAVGIFYGSLTAKPSGKTTTLADDLAVAKPDFVDALGKAGLITLAEIKTVDTLTAVTLNVGDKAADKLPKTVKVTYKDDTSKDLAVTWPAVDTTKPADRQTIEGTFAGYKSPTAKIDVTVVAASSSVSGVVSDNLKTIFVKFAKTMNADTLTTDTVKCYVNGSATAATLAGNPVLSDDKLTAGIVFSSNLAQNDSVQVVIDGAKDTDGTAMTKYDNKVTVSDKNDPVLSKLELNNYKKLTLTASEPINADTAGVFTMSDTNAKFAMKIDGSYVYAKYTAVPGKNQVTIDLNVGLAKGDHTINIASAKDYAGFVAAAKDFTVTRPEDTAAPKAQSVTYSSKTSVKVTFDEEIYNLGNATFQVYQAGDSTDLMLGAVAPAIDSSDAKTVVLTLASGKTFNVSATVAIDVKYKNVEDIYGNKTTDFTTISGKAADNSTKPTATVTVESGNILKVAFTKEVAAKVNADFILLNSDGSTNQATATSVIDYASSADNKTFKVSFNALNSVNPTAYQLKITGVKDTTIRENVIDDVTLPFTSVDTKRPQIGSAVYSGTGSTWKFTLTFSEAVDATAATNLTNYFIGGTSLSSISNASITLANDSKSVTIAITTNGDSYNGATVTCPTVKDTAGNIIGVTGPGTSAVLSLSDTNSFISTDVSVQLVAKNQIKLVAGAGKLFSAVDPAGIKLAVNDAVQSNLIVSMAQIAGDQTYVTLTTNVDMSAYGTYTAGDGSTAPVKLYVDANNTGTKDQFGTKLVIAAPGISVTGAANDKCVPTELSIARDATLATTINVKFDEDIQAASGAASVLAAAFTVKNGSTVLNPFTDYTTAIDPTNRIVVITITKSALSNATLTVQLTNANLIKDFATTPNVGCTTIGSVDVASITTP